MTLGQVELVIASEAKQSRGLQKTRLLRRYVPGNDESGPLHSAGQQTKRAGAVPALL
jgi:hypothetical protein